MRINAIIVDDHLLFAEGLIALLKEVKTPTVEVIHISHDGEDIFRWLSKRRVHLIFLDLNLGKVNGLDLIEPIKKHSPGTRIMVVSGYSDGNFVKTAFLNGADGYVLKGSPLEELRHGILTIMEDNTFMGKGVQVTTKSTDKKERNRYGQRQTRAMDSYSLMNDLTKREQQILELITQAFSNKEIARKLYISDQTVSVHRKNIMRKLGVTNTVSLVKAAQSLSISG
ncbi:MAG: response regulator transcription factor [Saprospiraceae bacterium]|nr:response regulator transcription factor [Saprospiraceae bacterium]